MGTVFDSRQGGSLSPELALEHLLRGVYATQLIGIAAKLGLADRLREGPRSSKLLAEEVGADPGALQRVLRGLALYGIFSEIEPGNFALAPLGELLRADVPQSMLDAALLVHDLTARAAGALEETVRTGVPAFRLSFGRDLFEHLAANPDLSARFGRLMSRQNQLVAELAVRAYDFSTARKVVDVGGGRGHLLSAVLRAHPAVAGVLFDLSPMIAQAEAALADGPLRGRCTLASGDFFEAVPEGGDVYLLSWVLHDWDDARAARILANCRRAFAQGGRLLVIEHLSPERVLDEPAAVLMDLDMLLNVPGRERTLPEYRALLAEAGLAVARVVPLEGPHGRKLRTLIEAVPAAGG